MKAKMTVDSEFEIGKTDDRIFGGFVEHFGRCVYDGLYEPGHPQADSDGFRNDVAKLVKDLGMPVTRYPGGNFVSGFDWHDSVGPRNKRPVRADYAWAALEPNEIGIDEFMKWCRKVGTMPLVAVNLGAGTARSAQELVEYCNFPGGTYWSDLRRKNGTKNPHGIKLWCLGNEMDGDWQIGHKTAAEYGRIAHEAAKMMKLADPSIELCACGSSSRSIPTFGIWDSEVLNETFHDIDYLSMHAYFGCPPNGRAEFLGAPDVLDRQIRDTIALCDAASAKKKSKKQIGLALDEWNVWYRGNPNAHPETKWHPARPINEEIYDMADVLVVGGILAAMLNHADRLKIGCLAQTVNVIAPIMTRKGGGAWKQTTYYPFQLTSRYGRGTVLFQKIESPEYEISNSICGPVKYLLGTAVLSRDGKELRVFAINRSLDSEMEFSFRMNGFVPEKVAAGIRIYNSSLDAVNTETEEAVKPEPIPAKRYSLSGNTLTARLDPASWNMFRIMLKQ